MGNERSCLVSHFTIPPPPFPLSRAAFAKAKTQGQLGSKSFAPGEVCKSIEKKTNTTIELSVSKKSGVLTVIIYGANDRAVSTARREVQCALCVQVTTTISVPHSARAHIVGAGGKNLKYITSKTMTKINMGRQPESSPTSSSPDSTSAEDKPDTDVVISGDYEGVEEAKREIESIVAARLSKSTAKFPIDRSLLPFLSGPNNSQIDTLMLETDVKIHIPPIFIRDGDSKNSDEIIIVGLKENVAVAEQRLKELYERVVSLAVGTGLKRHYKKMVEVVNY